MRRSQNEVFQEKQLWGFFVYLEIVGDPEQWKKSPPIKQKKTQLWKFIVNFTKEWFIKFFGFWREKKVAVLKNYQKYLNVVGKACFL